jgi:ABC-type sugar transport system ATPase subunit
VQPYLEVRGISKKFPGVQALRSVSLAVAPGSCHAFVGENGAGKSTLGKIIAGLHQADTGEIYLRGRRQHFAGPIDAMRAGVAMVHQELLFCENLTVAENLCLAELPRCGIFVNRKRMQELASERLNAIGANIQPDALVGELPISKQQLVQIASALGRKASLLIFDEPTSSLTSAEMRQLFRVIRSLQQSGVTCLYVSHRLEEIFELCDMVTVLRDGEVVDTQPTQQLTKESLVQKMIGRSLAPAAKIQRDGEVGDELLRAEEISSEQKFQGVSLSVGSGEIVGLAGLVGSGRTEVAEALFGLDANLTGRILWRGSPVKLRHPAEAMRLGIGLVPEDRKRHGLALLMNARENITLPILPNVACRGFVDSGMERGLAARFFALMGVRAAGIESAAAGLSGGNQQKLVLAKWLAAECKLLIIDEPTRGVDVAAKAEIHELIRGLAREGKAILLISSELPELLSLSTRIVVMREGRVVGRIPGSEASEESVMRLMAGIKGGTIP